MQSVVRRRVERSPELCHGPVEDCLKERVRRCASLVAPIPDEKHLPLELHQVGIAIIPVSGGGPMRQAEARTSRIRRRQSCLMDGRLPTGWRCLWPSPARPPGCQCCESGGRRRPPPSPGSKGCAPSSRSQGSSTGQRRSARCGNRRRRPTDLACLRQCEHALAKRWMWAHDACLRADGGPAHRACASSRSGCRSAVPGRSL